MADEWKAKLAAESRTRIRDRIREALLPVISPEAPRAATERGIILEKHMFQWANSEQDYLDQILLAVDRLTLVAPDPWEHQWFPSTPCHFDEAARESLEQDLVSLMSS